MRTSKLLKQAKINLLCLCLLSLSALAAESPFVLKAKSTSINMKTGTTQFDDGIVINHGNLQINAATLTQQQDTEKKQEKMQLTGKPAQIHFKRDSSTLETQIQAEDIIFYPDLGILNVTTNSKLEIREHGKIKTVIIADSISLKLDTKKIETIHAEGSPLQYNLSPGDGKEAIFATAEKLSLNQKSGDVELFNASVKQNNDEFRAGKILVDGATGNLSAHGGSNDSRPSLSIELDKELIEEKKQQEQKP